MRYKYHSYVRFADEATKAWEDWLACPWSTQLVKGGEKIHLQICFDAQPNLCSHSFQWQLVCVKYVVTHNQGCGVVGAITQTDSFRLAGSSLSGNLVFIAQLNGTLFGKPSLTSPLARTALYSEFHLRLSSGPFTL